MFEDKRRIDPSIQLPLEENRPKESEAINSGSLLPSEGTLYSIPVSEVLCSHSNPEKQAEWDRTFHTVTEIIDGAGRFLDEEIMSAVTGLMVLGFKTCNSCEGHLDHGSPSPLVEIGERGSYLQIRYNGQEEIFRRLLKEIPIPLALRFSHPLATGFSRLSPEIFEAIDSPAMRRNHWGFVSSVMDAYTKSMLDSSRLPHKNELNFTQDELERRGRNIQAKLQIENLVEEFNRLNPAPLELSLYVKGHEGHPFDLVAGFHPEGEKRDADVLKARQAHMKHFANFLKDRFFSTSSTLK